MTTSPFSQPATVGLDVADAMSSWTPRSVPDAETPSYVSYVSYLASYALTLPEAAREEVRQSVPAELQAQYDQALMIQGLKGDTEASATRQRILDGEVQRLQLRDEAAALHRQAKLDALADTSAEAAASFAGSILNTDTLAEIVVPDPLIEDYLDLNCTARVYGPSGSKKSFVLLDMAACIATGKDWHGKKTTQRNVLYVVAEGSTGTMKRVRAWEAEHGRKMTGVHFRTEAVQINDPEQMRGLIAYAKQIEAGLVIFDTQSRCTVGVDENSNTDMGTVVANLDMLRKQTGACALLVHHSGNEGGRARGATAVLGAMDAEFEVSCPDRGFKVGFKTTKRKDGEEMPKITFRLAEHTVTTTRGLEKSLAVCEYASVAATDSDSEVDVVTVRDLSDRQADVLEALARYDVAGCSQVGKDAQIPRNRASQTLSQLRKLDCVESVGGVAQGKYRVTDIGWTTLNRIGLTTGYRQVAPLDDEGDE